MGTWSRSGSCAVVVVALGLGGCGAVRHAAVNRLGDALASGTSSYATDDDPEFVGDALPFGLKTIEGLLAESPRHRGLLLAATSGFTQYAYAYLESEADYVEDADAARATVLKGRAQRMYRRAIGYGVRGLDAARPGWRAAYDRDPAAAMRAFGRADVPQLYWTAAALGAGISANKSDAELAADLPLVDALIRRAVELEPHWGDGTLDEFLIAWEGGRPAAAGGSADRARKAFERAVAASHGRRAAPYVSFAETVDVATQDPKEFEDLLGKALAIDADAVPAERLANLVAQKRARWLLSRKEMLFL